MTAPEHIVIVALGPSAYNFIRAAEHVGGLKAYCDELWGINVNGSILRCDRVFHMDDFKIQELRVQNGCQESTMLSGMLEWMRQTDVPIYTSRSYSDYPSSVDFPLADVIKSCGTPYFNGTVPYAITFAMHLGVKKLSLFGMDYTYPDVGGAEAGRACTEYWVGRAMERGIEVFVDSSSTLMDNCLPADRKFYGYDTLDLDVEIVAGEVTVNKRVRAVPRNAEEIDRQYNHSQWACRSKHGLRGGEALDRLLECRDVQTVLDVGAGEGDHAEIIKASGREVHCVALAPKPEKLNGTKWLQEDFAAVQLDQKYDAIWASHVLEHQPNPQEFLRKCFDSLRDDGILAITVPPAKHDLVGGHVTLWNSGLVLYNLILAGFDCSGARVSGQYTHITGQPPYNVSVMVRKRAVELPDLAMDFGDIEKLRHLFPVPVVHGIDGNLQPVNW